MSGAREAFDLRRNPFTGAWEPATSNDRLANMRSVTGRFDPGLAEDWSYVGEWHEVDATSHYIRLREGPKEETPSTVEVWPITFVDTDIGGDVGDTTLKITDYDRVDVDDVITVDDEKMQCTAKPGDPDLTVTRGYDGTTRVAHEAGTPVYNTTMMTEVAASPNAKEYRVDYDNQTGYIELNTAQDDWLVRCVYERTGTVTEAHLGNLQGTLSPFVPWFLDGSVYRPSPIYGVAASSLYFTADTTIDKATYPDFFYGLDQPKICLIKCSNFFVASGVTIDFDVATDDRRLVIIQCANVFLNYGTLDLNGMGGGPGGGGGDGGLGGPRCRSRKPGRKLHFPRSFRGSGRCCGRRCTTVGRYRRCW